MELLEAQISLDEGDALWAGVFKLADFNDGTAFAVGTPFDFDLYGETFKFIVTQKNISKPAAGEVEVTLNCSSPAAQLIAPYAQPITKTWGTTTAQSIAVEVLDGFPLSWEILDWPLSQNLFSASDQMPLEIVQTLAEAVGGVVESRPDGVLRVRYRFPLSVPEYGAGTADHMIAEMDDVFSSNEGFVGLRLANKLRVMNQEVAAESADRLEFKEDSPGQGTLYAYPSPWRTTFTVESTKNDVVIGAVAYNERQEMEVVEVVTGKARVAYPILSIVSAEYLDADLGGVVFAEGSSEVQTTTGEGYSLLRLTYLVRSLTYPITGTPGDQAQFLMKE